MNRQAVEAELPVQVRRWLQRHASDDTWAAIGRDVAVVVAAALLTHNGEAGINPELYKLLCRHPSPAVRALAQSAEFRNRRWYAKWIAYRVAAWFGVSRNVLYDVLRRKVGNKSLSAGVRVRAVESPHLPQAEDLCRSQPGAFQSPRA